MKKEDRIEKDELLMMMVPRKASKKTQGTILALIAVLFIISIGIFIVSKAKVERLIEDPDFFQSELLSQKYAKIEPIYLTQPFSEGVVQSFVCVFAITDDHKAYLVKITNKDYEKYADLVEHTYSDTDAAVDPGDYVIKGVPTEITAEIHDFAVESFNITFGKNYVNDNNFQEVFGVRMLDATQTISILDDTVFAVTFQILATVIVLYIALTASKASRRRKYYKNITQCDKALLTMVQEDLHQQDATYYSPGNFYVTPRFLVSGQFIFHAYRYEEIEKIYTEPLQKKEKISHCKIILKQKSGQRIYMATVPYNRETMQKVQDAFCRIETFSGIHGEIFSDRIESESILS